jgi:hypothetical protein
MSTLKSSAEDLTLNADGSGNDVIIQSDGSTKMTIVDTGYVEMAGATDVRLTLGSTGTAGTNDASWLRGNGADLLYNSASGDHKWEVGGTEKLRIQAAGGISFNGDTAAANALDDYEEGTWTPEDSSGTDYAVNGAQTYVKVGRLVAFTMDVNVMTSGGDIYGLPFTQDGSATGVTIGYTSYSGGVYGFIGSDTVIHMYSLAGSLINSSNDRFIIGGTYYVDS